MAITYSSADELGNTTEGFLEIRENTSGGWKSARLIIVVQMAERFAYFGIASNLIMYLTGPLGESTAAAAANVNAWTGTVAFLPLLGGFLADSYLGRFRTIIISSSLYILGLGLLSFSTMIPSHQSKDSNQLQETIFFFSLYLVAIGQGGYNPCIKVFGADQFDGNDHKEARDKSSFFNWLMFGNCISILTTRLVSTYIQENLSWSLGFGIPSVSMLLSLFLFLLGTTSYRFSTERVGKKNPFARISRVFMEALKNRRQPDLDIANANANETLLLLAHQSSKQFRFLDRAAISCELAEIEEAKAGLGLLSFSAMTSSNSKDPNQLQVILFFCSLYLIAIGQGGYKPCIKVFGADQFDGNDIKDAKDKSSYFNWLMFGSCVSILTFRLVSSYIQEDLSWSLGFGIPSVFMLLALFLFLLGTKTYRFSTAREGKKNPFARISHVFMAALKNRTQPDSYIANPNETLLTHQSSKQFRFLNKAAISCSFAEIEEAKAVLKLVPCG
ncbi:unnamed protein product [Arabidopsis thaliana]|uniref:(thale cress) hypothetical protein n=1 Tax=Arabidopsis thaliana TaxID=3702 RepID=A0A7G2E585_ARATH|nr:unnamed protein product [Arabidopsis thaliana]